MEKIGPEPQEPLVFKNDACIALQQKQNKHKLFS